MNRRINDDIDVPAILTLIAVVISTLVLILSVADPSLASPLPPALLTPSKVAQTSATPVLTPTIDATITATPILTPTSASDSVTQGELLAVYRDLVESNTQAIKSAHNTLNFVLVMATIVTSLVAATGALSLSNARGANQLAKKASSGVKELESTKEQIERELIGLRSATEQVKEQLEKLNSDLSQSLDKLLKLEQLEARLGKALKEQEDQIRGDTEVLERLHALAQVDRYAMELFGDDAMRRTAAKKGLLQLSNHEDPVIRRECLRVFATMPNYLDDWIDEEIFAQIDYAVNRDVERGVRKEAEATRDEWKRRGGKRLKRVKSSG